MINFTEVAYQFVPNERYRLANPFQVSLKGKIKHLSKYWGSSTQDDWTTPVGEILGVATPCNPCGVDAYGSSV